MWGRTLPSHHHAHTSPRVQAEPSILGTGSISTCQFIVQSQMKFIISSLDSFISVPDCMDCLTHGIAPLQRLCQCGDHRMLPRDLCSMPVATDTIQNRILAVRSPTQPSIRSDFAVGGADIRAFSNVAVHTVANFSLLMTEHKCTWTKNAIPLSMNKTGP